MNRALLVCFLALLGVTGAMAQSNSVVGKWKIASLKSQGLNIDLENPASAKKLMAEEIQKESGTAPDSATIEQAFAVFSAMFEGMSLEFTRDGKGIAMIPDGTGSYKADSATYTVDYVKGLLSTVSKEGAETKKEEYSIKFEGEYLVMVKNDGETMRLKKAK